MLDKIELEKKTKRIKAFWNGENEDRPILLFQANKNFEKKNTNEKMTIEEKWNNPQKFIEYSINNLESKHFMGEAIPTIMPSLGAGSLAAYMGCKVNKSDNKIWLKPFIEDIDEYKMFFDKNNYWWKGLIEIYKKAAELCKDYCLIGYENLGASLDVLSLMRGNENLCIDMLENPEKIKEHLLYIYETYLYCLDSITNIVTGVQQGTIDWVGLWTPEPAKTIECDFGALISPERFKEFAVPEISALSKRFNYSLYHMDGDTKNIDTLLDIPELKVIQWSAVLSDTYTPLDWIPLFQKIQNKGKGLYIYARPFEVDELMKYISPKGVCICLLGSMDSFEQGNDFIKHVCNASYKKKIY